MYVRVRGCDFAVFPSILVEFLLSLEEFALSFLQFDCPCVFVQPAFVVADVCCDFRLVVGFRIVSLDIVVCDLKSCEASFPIVQLNESARI